ncbi:MAG: response regulator transcription factor [Cephaloticoccus sp.]|nr:response regulator transcription factor [Cephaloticoccus sp.]MCF7761728.1 response regulator transcription factor [Cephaloticoccus sp.]
MSNQTIVKVDQGVVSLPTTGCNIVVAIEDRTHAEALGQVFLRAIHGAHVVYAQKGSELLEALASSPIDYLLIGLSFPDVPDEEIIQEISQKRLAKHILVFAERHDRPRLALLHTTRIDAIIDTHSETIEAVRAALRLVQKEQVYVSPSLLAFLIEKHPSTLREHLTPTELRVLRIIGTGCDNQEAAEQLALSPSTVQTHRKRIMHKFRVSTSARLVHEAIRLGYVRIPELAPDEVSEGFLP